MKRRQFLAGAVAAGPVIGLAAAGRAVAAETPPARAAVPAKPQTAGDTKPPAEVQRLTTGGKVGSDFMVDCLKALNIEYVTSCPGSTFRGMQESLINYGMNSKPEFITCIHEEASVAMAHGYAKIAGKPLASLVHGVVGLQHSSMAIYNAFCDQVPAVVLAGNVGQGTQRRPGDRVPDRSAEVRPRRVRPVGEEAEREEDGDGSRRDRLRFPDEVCPAEGRLTARRHHAASQRSASANPAGRGNASRSASVE